MKKHTVTLSHISYSVMFTTLLFSVCNAINMDKLAKWFVLGTSTDYSGLLALLGVGVLLFMSVFILFVHKHTVKFFSIVTIIVSAGVTYFIATYSIAFDTTMLMNAVHTDVKEATSFLSTSMLPYVFFLIVIPIAVLTRITVEFQKPVVYLSKSLVFFVVTLVFAVALIYIEFSSIHRAGNQSNKYILHGLVPVNIIVSSVGALEEKIVELTKQFHKEPEISAKSLSDDDLVIVLAIGESARQKNFNLYGYTRKNTNPFLQKTSGIHAINGIARLGSTLYALPEILARDGITLTAITSKVGINTSCYVHYTLYDNCATVGEIKVSSCGNGGKCFDEDVIPLLENNLRTYDSGKRLIVLHLGGGSHGPSYENRYPPQYQRFNPQCLEADVVNNCTVEQLYNSYDNTILYTDFVLGEILTTLDNSSTPYVFIYLSDHGESLLEDGRIFHGTPPGIALPPEQAEIPLIIKSSLPISIVKRDEYTQPDVFDTILDLFSIEIELLNKSGVFIKKEDAS